MPDISSLYPQPPQQQQNMLQQNPLQLLGALGQINQLRQFQAEFGARKAIGKAYQGALQPDGTVDFNALRQGLSNPEASYGLPQATTDLLNQRGVQSGQAFDANQRIMSWVTSLDPNKTTPDMISSGITGLATSTGIPSSFLVATRNMILEDARVNGMPHAIANFRNAVIGAAGVSGRVPGPPGPGGEQQTTTLGQANLTGTMPTSQPVGEEVPQTGAAGRAAALAATATSSSQYHADLENLKQDSRVMDRLGGPTAQTEKQWAQLSARLGGLLPATISPDQLKAMESFDKISNQISANQSQLLGASTDAGRHMLLGANPSTSMSSYGREGVIDMLQGNQDAVDTARDLWNSASGSGVPANYHDKFMQRLSSKPLDTKYGGKFDPRVFQFNRMSWDNKQKFLGQMAPDQAGQFEKNYQSALLRGWVQPLVKPAQ